MLQQLQTLFCHIVELPVVTNVVTLKAIHYGNGDSDDEDMTNHTYKIAKNDSENHVIANLSDEIRNKAEIRFETNKVKAPRLLKCEKCDKQFTNSRKLKVHKMNFRKKDCAQSKAKDFNKLKTKCNSCGKSFQSRQSLNVHKFQNNCQVNSQPISHPV